MLSPSENVLSCAKLWAHKARKTDTVTVFSKMLNSVVMAPLSTSTRMSACAGILPAECIFRAMQKVSHRRQTTKV